MKKILSKRFELWDTIWIIAIMIVEYFIGEIWDAGIWALIISVVLFVVIICLAELFHKKRFDKYLQNEVKEFVVEAKTVLGESNETILEQYVISNEVDNVDRVAFDVYKLNYYVRKLKQPINYGDEKVQDVIKKGEKIWSGITDEYIGKDEKLGDIILQSAKLTWLQELIEKNKESDDYVFPLRYNCFGVEEECSAEELVNRREKGQRTVFIADGGYGKTWTVERMARIYAERYISSFCKKGRVNGVSEFPVLVKVGDINNSKDRPVQEKMKEQLCSIFVLQTLENMNKSYEILSNDVLFVDALDEARNPEVNDLIFDEMKQYQNTAIFTTRDTDVSYLNRLNNEEAIIRYRIADVNEQQVRKYLEKELARKEDDVELKSEEIEKVLLEFNSSGFAEKCTSPFLLHCFIKTVRETKMDFDKVFDIGENINKLYGVFIVGIIERERKGKSLRGLISVDEVLGYLNKFAIAILDKREEGLTGNEADGLTGNEATMLAKEYFGAANFDGRNLENAEKDINVSLKEMHIFSQNEGKYRFISDDFMNAVIGEEQIDEIMKFSSRGIVYNNENFKLIKLKLDNILSSKEVNGIGAFIKKVYKEGVNAERVLVLLQESMASVNLNYIQENADELYMDILVRWIDSLESDRKQMHSVYERNHSTMCQYFTAWIIGKTKKLKFNEEEFKSEYENFRYMISVIQRVNEIKRCLLTPQNIEYIMKSYGTNNYPKFLWLQERFANYEHSFNKYRRGNSKYNYPKNLESICKTIIEEIDEGFEFYGKVKEMKSRIEQNSSRIS